jgi:hypothetical protein
MSVLRSRLDAQPDMGCLSGQDAGKPGRNSTSQGTRRAMLGDPSRHQGTGEQDLISSQVHLDVGGLARVRRKYTLRQVEVCLRGFAGSYRRVPAATLSKILAARRTAT